MINPESGRNEIVSGFNEDMLRIVSSNPVVLRKLLTKSLGPMQLTALGLLASNPNGEIPVEDLANLFLGHPHPHDRAVRAISDLRISGFDIKRRKGTYSLVSGNS